jgi:hypothetical protein
MIKEPVTRCPHCGKCCEIAIEHDEGVSITLHKDKPPKQPYSVRTISRRRCDHPNCREYYYVEGRTSLSILLRWLIFHDPDALAREIFENNLDLIKKLRQDKKFMEMINNDQND